MTCCFLPCLLSCFLHTASSATPLPHLLCCPAFYIVCCSAICSLPVCRSIRFLDRGSDQLSPSAPSAALSAPRPFGCSAFCSPRFPSSTSPPPRPAPRAGIPSVRADQGKLRARELRPGQRGRGRRGPGEGGTRHLLSANPVPRPRLLANPVPRRAIQTGAWANSGAWRRAARGEGGAGPGTSRASLTVALGGWLFGAAGRALRRLRLGLLAQVAAAQVSGGLGSPPLPRPHP